MKVTKWICPAPDSRDKLVRQIGSLLPPSLALPLLWVEYSQTLQHSCAAHTTRSLFTAEQPVTLPGPHSIETLASDPVATVTPPDVSLLSAAEAGAVTDCAPLWSQTEFSTDRWGLNKKVYGSIEKQTFSWCEGVNISHASYDGLVLMIRGRFGLMKTRPVYVPVRQPEALWDSVLMTALALRGSGEASRAAAGLWPPWCPTTAVANVLLFFFFQGWKLTFPEALPAYHSTSSPQPENSKWRLKTTIRQLCQHGHPSPRKHLYGNRRGASANTDVLTYPHTHTANPSQCNIRLHSPLQHLSYLHAIGRSHTPPHSKYEQAALPRHTH